MTSTVPITAMPIREGLAALLREKTDTIDNQCTQFLIGDDVEALHDLRVAMRRLHSLFAGFSPCFSEENTLPKRLRALHKKTNAARDIEVTLALVEKLQLDLPQLQQQWRKQLEQEYRLLRETIPPAWQALCSELTQPQEMLAGNLPDQALGTYAATLAAAKIKKLNSEMRALGNKWTKQRAHKLRICGKRVRYLLEPFVEESESVATAVAQLKRFQDLLGDYHDIVVLRQKLHNLQQDDSAHNPEQYERACHRLDKALRQLRKTFLRDYRRKKRQRLHDLLHQAGESLGQTTEMRL